MFGNLVNRHDLALLASRGPAFAAQALRRLGNSGRNRTIATWSAAPRPASSWVDIPAIRARWNMRVSGSPDTGFEHYVTTHYLRGREDLHAISLGCGSGALELRWAASGRFARIDAWDLSPSRIEHARRAAREAGLDSVVHYHAGDVAGIPVPEPRCDLVIAQGSMHHFAPLERIMQHIARLLAPGGLFVLEDFVGPTRFQWSAAQIEATNALLARLPSERTLLRADARGRTRPKPPVFAPSRLRMWLGDPSEAVESGRIMQLLPQRFEVLEMRQLGGTVLHLLFNGIAHHFLAADEQTLALLEMCIGTEDELLAAGRLPSDFVAAICRVADTAGPDVSTRIASHAGR